MDRDELIDDLEEILESWTGERDYREDRKATDHQEQLCE